MNDLEITGDSSLLERRLASWLRAQAPARAPGGFLDGLLASLDGVERPWVGRRLALLVRSPELLGAALVIALVVVAIGGLALLPGRGGGWTAGAGGVPSYEGIQFRADGLAITVPGGVFTLDPAVAQVHSDSGSWEYRTLEFTWQQRGVEMRLNLYFAGDGREWWLSDARTYDGRARGEWIAYEPDARRPIGTAFDGPLDLVGTGPTGAGRLQIARLVLLPTFPAKISAATTGPTSGPNGDISPFAAGQVLNCVGAERMTPQQMASFARARGYAVSWRYLTIDADGQNGMSENREPPPGSVVWDAAWGTSGELIILASPPDEPTTKQLSADWACPPPDTPPK